MYREGNEQITDTLEVYSLNANGEYLIRLSYIPLGNINIRAFKVRQLALCLKLPALAAVMTPDYVYPPRIIRIIPDRYLRVWLPKRAK